MLRNQGMEQGSTLESGIASTPTAPPEPSSLGTTTSGDSNGDSCSACKCGGASKGSAVTEGTGAEADVSGNTVTDASAVVVAPKPAVKVRKANHGHERPCGCSMSCKQWPYILPCVNHTTRVPYT